MKIKGVLLALQEGNRIKDCVMEIIPGWTATWRDHSGKSWGLKGASQKPALDTPPPCEVFKKAHDFRTQIYSPSSGNDAAAFLASFQREEPPPTRFFELTWEFGCPTPALWDLGVNLTELAVELCKKAGRDTNIIWAIEGKEMIYDGEVRAVADLPPSTRVLEGRGFCLSVGDIEVNTRAEKRGGEVRIVNLIWPADIPSEDLGIPALVAASKPVRLETASLPELEHIINNARKYMEPEPV